MTDLDEATLDVVSPVEEPATALFGGRNRTEVLLAIQLLEETYPSELAALLGLRLFSVQSIVAAYEREGALVSRPMGRTRRVTLNPAYPAYRELKALLTRMATRDPALRERLTRSRLRREVSIDG